MEFMQGRFPIFLAKHFLDADKDTVEFHEAAFSKAARDRSVPYSNQTPQSANTRTPRF